MSQAHETGTAQLTLLRGADLVASPWKNGGGVTREIAVANVSKAVAKAAPNAAPGAAPDAFAWRVSVADVAQAGPFSRFEGVARTLVLLEGAGMVLDETAPSGGALVRTHTLTRALDVARFDGEAPIDARLVDGPTRDFNLMVRRDAARASFDVWRDNVARRIEADTVLLYCAQGAVNVCVNGGEPTRLAAGDTLRIDTTAAADLARAVRIETRIETQGGGALLAIALDLVNAHAD
ncbi:HutD family protein [Paraburkholderia silviterrae]|uniref:HutD family protein n=1 Tax=Paraburkholderia silviterrae TaxID=2528715 RepID=A0A4R5LYP1_9BURK|nr:HutD family protein [Paraburkholderia silviterrae]TDG17606.1 HutD family protein [Paraburkholderia silviterrae]